MNINEMFLHNFYYSYKILNENQFRNILKSILTHSLVSYNWFMKNVDDEYYKQNWNSRIYGYSKDYVSLVDLKDVFSSSRKYKRSEVVDFMQSGAFVLLKRDWIEKQLKESCNVSIFNKPKAVRREFINSLIGKYNLEYLIEKGFEYVLPGEVKIKDYIPVSEIYALVFGEHFFETNPDDINIVKEVLRETNMEDLSLYNLYCDIPPHVDNIDNIKKYELRKLR